MRVKKIMRIYQNGPLDKFMRFLFMYSSVLYNVWCEELWGTNNYMYNLQLAFRLT